MMTPAVLLILAAFSRIQTISGDTFDNGFLPKIMPSLPAVSEVCFYDAFLASDAINGKVFLFPWETEEQRGNWLQARGYCAAHCAEMVTIHTEAENKFFLDFMRNVGFDDTGVDGSNVAIWLGAQVNNKTFSDWSNGEKGEYNPKATGEYDEDGLTCLNAAYGITNNFWYNNFCDWNYYFVACQRPSNWSITGKEQMCAQQIFQPCPRR